MKHKLFLLLATSVMGAADAASLKPLVIKGGVTQQIQPADTLSVPTTYANLNASHTAVDINLGGCISTDYPGGSPGDYSTTPFASCIVTPNGAYTGGVATWPDAAVTAIAINGSAGHKTSVPLMTFGGTTVSGSNIYGANINAVNCRNYSLGCTFGTGFDFLTHYGLEIDLNLYSKSGSVAPTGEAYGLSVQLFGDTQTASGNALGAVHVVGSPVGDIPFKTAFSTGPAAAQTGMFLNSIGTSPSTSNSQGITFISRIAGTGQTATIYEDSGGMLQLTAPAGATSNNPFRVVANSAGGIPTSCTVGTVVTGNYLTGSGEVDHFNCANSGGGFAWFQKTGASTVTQVMRLDDTGNVTIPNTLTAPNVKLTEVNVADLPPCNAGASGLVSYVKDASGPTYNATLTGGGGARALAVCNGTNWTAH